MGGTPHREWLVSRTRGESLRDLTAAGRIKPAVTVLFRARRTLYLAGGQSRKTPTFRPGMKALAAPKEHRVFEAVVPERGC